MKLTLNDIKKSKCAHLNEHLFQQKHRKQKILPKNVQWMKEHILSWCVQHEKTLLEEHRFHPARKWRFDFAIKELKIGIEYEGINSQKSRHTTITGYSGDADKYNAAQALGWKVLRFTTINFKDVIKILNENLNYPY